MKVCVLIEGDLHGFTATVPALPGCVVWGPTEEQVKREIGCAIELRLGAVPDPIPACARAVEVGL